MGKLFSGTGGQLASYGALGGVGSAILNFGKGIGGSLGGKDEKQKVEGRPFTPQETKLIDQQIQMAELQLKAVQSAMMGVDDTRALQPVLDSLMKDFKSASSGGIGLKKLGEKFGIDFKAQFSKVQDDILRGATASEEDAAQIDRLAEEAISAGMIDIERFQTQGLESIRNVLAPSRGLRPGDSPIIDRGSEIVQEGARQFGQLSANVRGQAAAQKLAFPLQRRSADLAGLGAQFGAATGLAEFQKSLRDTAFQNRLALGGFLAEADFTKKNLAVGAGSGIPLNLSGTLASIAGAQGQTIRTTGSPDIGALMGGGGALLMGAGAMSSSIRLKDPIDEVDDEAVLDKVKRLRVERWTWKPEVSSDGSVHSGPYAEDMKELFDVGDGTTMPVYDMIGVLFAMVKALDRKLQASK